MNHLEEYVYHQLVSEGVDLVNDGEEVANTLNLFEAILSDYDIYLDIGAINIEPMRTYVQTINRIKLLEDIDTELCKKTSPPQAIKVDKASDIFNV